MYVFRPVQTRFAAAFDEVSAGAEQHCCPLKEIPICCQANQVSLLRARVANRTHIYPIARGFTRGCSVVVEVCLSVWPRPSGSTAASSAYPLCPHSATQRRRCPHLRRAAKKPRNCEARPARLQHGVASFARAPKISRKRKPRTNYELP